ELDTLIAEELAKKVDPQPHTEELDAIVATNRELLRARIQAQAPKRTGLLRMWLPWAGVVLFVSAIALYLNTRPTAPALSTETKDVAAGTNRAVITLADGHAIELSEDHHGVVIDNGSIAYTDGS